MKCFNNFKTSALFRRAQNRKKTVKRINIYWLFISQAARFPLKIQQSWCQISEDVECGQIASDCGIWIFYSPQLKGWFRQNDHPSQQLNGSSACAQYEECSMWGEGSWISGGFALFLSDHRVPWVLGPSAHYQLTHTHRHTSLLSHGRTGDGWMGSIWSIPRVLCGCSSTCGNNMTSGQEDSHDPVLIWHIPDLALSSFTFLFLCAIAIGRTKRWDSFLSVSAVLRGHLIDNSLCRKKNNEHSSPRRFYSDRGCDRKERIWHNHHTRACLWVTNHKNNNAVHIHALPEDKLAPGLPADTSCECLNWPDSPQRSSALEIDWLAVSAPLKSNGTSDSDNSRWSLQWIELAYRKERDCKLTFYYVFSTGQGGERTRGQENLLFYDCSG